MYQIRDDSVHPFQSTYDLGPNVKDLCKIMVHKTITDKILVPMTLKFAYIKLKLPPTDAISRLVFIYLQNTQRIRSRFEGEGRVGGGAVSAPPNDDGVT